MESRHSVNARRSLYFNKRFLECSHSSGVSCLPEHIRGVIRVQRVGVLTVEELIRLDRRHMQVQRGLGRERDGNEIQGQFFLSVPRDTRQLTILCFLFVVEVETSLVLVYLEKEWALVLGLRAGWPEPVGQWSGLGCGDKVAKSHWLLKDVQSLLVGLHTVCTLAL